MNIPKDGKKAPGVPVIFGVLFYFKKTACYDNMVIYKQLEARND
jgi:hypothetical protein